MIGRFILQAANFMREGSVLKDGHSGISSNPSGEIIFSHFFYIFVSSSLVSFIAIGVHPRQLRSALIVMI